jgi:hypothetical protein
MIPVEIAFGARCSVLPLLKRINTGRFVRFLIWTDIIYLLYKRPDISEFGFYLFHYPFILFVAFHEATNMVLELPYMYFLELVIPNC